MISFRSALALGLILAAASPATAADVVARIGGTDVTTDDVRAYVETLSPSDQAALAKDPALVSQAVRAYLARQLVLKEAKDKKFDQQATTKAQLERVREAALIEAYLQSVAKVPDGFPSDSDLQAAYDANKTAFLAPRQYRLAQIFIAAPKGDKTAEDKGKARLDEVMKKLKGRGADFTAIAREFSDSGSDSEIGWVAEPQIVPEIRQAAAGLGTDAVSEPIRLDDGWHFIKLLETKPSGTRPFAEVRDALAERLRQTRSGQLRQAYLAKLTQQNPMPINELALAKLAPKAPK
ncbi:peptidyl-prolyl cis-trans isomerase [Magnetospirillum fulvum]|uniref:Parvulin-like PPIase n=1 Tax=Magnetospirillum fulvum TaxID=1082 RepID=A0A1H6HAU3_MAGFU|nr:peptidyl-prolyl cis-trans isomerase [Magnetospirillum fulvum]SEH32927.1 peptidylprolyl isomerase [Magnetospirillum fulvum]